MMKPTKNTFDVAIIASDVKAILEFYRDILGLEYIGESPIWFGTIHRLRFGNSDLKVIQPSSMPPKGPVGLESQLGFRYITFVIHDLTGLCKELKNRGVEFFLHEKEIRTGVRIAMVKDPDGNIVEFVERS